MLPGRALVQSRRLNWGESDPAGTIYAPRAIDFGIQAVEAAWIESLDLPFGKMHATRIGTPWVHTSCEFERPLRAGEPFELRVWLEKMGGSSFTWRGVAARPDGEVLFRLHLVCVAIDPATGRACPIPADIRAALSAYLGAG